MTIWMQCVCEREGGGRYLILTTLQLPLCQNWICSGIHLGCNPIQSKACTLLVMTVVLSPGPFLNLIPRSGADLWDLEYLKGSFLPHELHRSVVVKSFSSGTHFLTPGPTEKISLMTDWIKFQWMNKFIVQANNAWEGPLPRPTCGVG